MKRKTLPQQRVLMRAGRRADMVLALRNGASAVEQAPRKKLNQPEKEVKR
jgi:hypothetical protein